VPIQTYECIVCGVYWQDLIEENPSSGVSSGICPICFRAYTDKVHQRQRMEKFFDCFTTADVYCDQFECAFRFSCLNSLIEDWKKKIISKEKGQVIKEEGKKL
jgi:hypothetical protein